MEVRELDEVELKEVEGFPVELFNAIRALGNLERLKTFWELYKVDEELPFTELMKRLELPPEKSAALSQRLRELQIGGLVGKVAKIKPGAEEFRSYYFVTPFGERFIDKLFDALIPPEIVVRKRRELRFEKVLSEAFNNANEGWSYERIPVIEQKGQKQTVKSANILEISLQ